MKLLFSSLSLALATTIAFASVMKKPVGKGQDQVVGSAAAQPSSSVVEEDVVVTTAAVKEERKSAHRRLPLSRTVLYWNDFEHPNPGTNPQPQPTGCTNLANAGVHANDQINYYYGGQGKRDYGATDHGSGRYGQHLSVEMLFNSGVYWESAHTHEFSDPQNIAGQHSIGMMDRPNYNDLLWLEFDAPEDQQFFNVELDFSSIDTNGCGGPFNTNEDAVAPQMELMLMDTSNNDHVIARQTITGKVGTYKWQYDWGHHSLTFDKGAARHLKIQFDLTVGGYAAFDNLLIYSDSCPATVELTGASLNGAKQVGRSMSVDYDATAGGYDIVSVDWGDGSAAGTALSHVYTKPGSYHMVITAADDTGCGAQTTLDVTIVDPPSPSISGDPHIRTWNGESFDFQGACDLVLLSNPDFANGLGINIHVRTNILRSWSYIETAVLQIGEHTLEVTGGQKSIRYILNGELEGQELATGQTNLGDFMVHFTRINDHQSRIRVDLDLVHGHGNAISVETFKEFVRVNLKPATPEPFEGSIGLLGSFPDGTLLARDGVTILKDPIEFGKQWQVLPSEPMLFHKAGVVDSSMECAMPETMSKAEKQRHRRLGEATITKEDAAIACARVHEADRDACIFDVLATNDKDMAGSY